MSQHPLIGALRVRAARETPTPDLLLEAADTRSNLVAPPPAPAVAAEPGDPYFSRLVKLVPAEVLTLYIAFKVVAAGFPGAWALTCLLLVLLVRTVGTKEAGKPIQWIAVVVACVSFVLWTYATGGHLPWLPLPTDPEKVAKAAQGAVSVAIGVWTFVVPYFYKGE